MIQKKVCVLGAFAVGKTSLVRRFVTSMFSDRYHTTIGVKIDCKELMLNGNGLNLVIWDIHGEDVFQRVRSSYLRGAAGYLLVVDGTRSSTLDQMLTLQARAQEAIGNAPFVVLLNKADLSEQWDLEEDPIADLEARGWTVIMTSAKTGAGVDAAFDTLARRLIAS
ncbi:MAG: Rab family GTPase [Longimicrobiales bacterium]